MPELATCQTVVLPWAGLVILSPSKTPCHLWCLLTWARALFACPTERSTLTGVGLSGTLPPDAGWQLPTSLTALELGNNDLRGGWAG